MKLHHFSIPLFISAIFISSVTSDTCTNRFTYKTFMKEVMPHWSNCSFVYEKFPSCRETVIVSYWNVPPYVDKKNETHVRGILPDMLRVMYDSCCMGCTELVFKEAPSQWSMLHHKNFSIGMPFESAAQSTAISGRSYISFLKSQETVFLAEEKRSMAVELTKKLFVSVINTWPLLVIALLMAVIAGCVVWLLDTWFNRLEFPEEFPRGPFEGFWWAFVSMTTVGYGDRSPKSLVAKLFAVLWILFGITIFSMYTATLTTALNASLGELKKPSFEGKKVGVLALASLGKSAAVFEDAVMVPYLDADTMIDELVEGKIEAVAIDEVLARYILPHFKSHVRDINVHHGVVIEGNSYGVVVTDPHITEMLRSFFETNEDVRKTIVHDVIDANYHELSMIEENTPDTSTFFSTSSPIFTTTLVSLICIGIFTILLGMFCRWMLKKHKSRLQNSLIGKMWIAEMDEVNDEKTELQNGNYKQDSSMDTLKNDVEEVKEKLERIYQLFRQHEKFQ